MSDLIDIFDRCPLAEGLQISLDSIWQENQENKDTEISYTQRRQAIEARLPVLQNRLKSESILLSQGKDNSAVKLHEELRLPTL